MLSKEVVEYLETNKVAELYKIFKPCFDWIDTQSETLLVGDLLNEFELSVMLDKSTAIYAKLCSVSNALESYLERNLYNQEVIHYKSLESVRAQDTSVAKAKARSAVSDIRDYLSDFKSYLMASQQNITTAQSRLKRLSVESSAKGIDFKGDKSNIPSEEKGW